MGSAGRLLRRGAPPRPAPDELEGWVLPYRLDRGLDPEWSAPASWTMVGNLDSPLEATVDPRGLVTPFPGGWSLDWWVGADDRWHLPSREVAVRQHLVDDMPVVETAMRVPSGDVVQRVYALRDGLDELVVVEIENRSPIPVALALGIRPFGPDRVTGARHIELAAAGHLTVDGRVALLLPKAPSRCAGSALDAGDVAAVVMEGEAGTELAPVRCDAGMATAALVWPLAHRTTLRFALPLERPARSRRAPGTRWPSPSRLASSAQVANGWRVQGDRGLRVVVPDERLQSAVDANRRFLLLGADAEGLSVPVVATLAGALDRQGFAREASELLASLVDAQEAGGAFGRDRHDNAVVLHAMANHWLLHRDVSFAQAHAPAVAQGAEWIARRRRRARGAPDAGRDARGLLDAAELLRAAGERGAADDAARAAAAYEAELDRHALDLEDNSALANVGPLLDAATTTWTWPPGHDRLAMAAFLDLARRTLIREVPGGLALCSRVEESWLGRGLEVHDAPTHAGRLSFAIRWHGDRPALLWELEAHPDLGPVALQVPGLDPTWSSTEHRGDALLAPVLPPGTPVRLKRR